MKRNSVSLLIWAVIGSLISSCMTQGGLLSLSKTNREKPAAIVSSSEIAILLSYNKHLIGLPKEALEEEKAKAEKAFTDFNGPIHRLRLAMVLSLSNPASDDYKRARTLLSVDLPEGAKPDPVLRDFAIFLDAGLFRLEEQETRHRALSQKLLKEQAVRDQEMSQKIKNQENQNQKLLQKLKEEEEQGQKLQKMIEELKTIEKNIMNDKKIMKRENGNPSQ